MVSIRPRRDDDKWIEAHLVERWGGVTMVVHGEVFNLLHFDILVADERAGLLIFRREPIAEILLLDVIEQGRGIGKALLGAVIGSVRTKRVALWVTTTNDNIHALAFYQKQGFVLKELRVGAVIEARKLKPSIPELSEDGIPIRDEIDLVYHMNGNSRN